MTPTRSPRRPLLLALPATVVAALVGGLTLGVAGGSATAATEAATTSPATASAPAASVAGAGAAARTPVAGITSLSRAGASTVPAGNAPADRSLTGAPAAAGPSAKALRTVKVSTAAQLQSALDQAKPGDLIALAGGTYRGPFLVRSSGTAANPVVVKPAGTGAVVLTASLPMPSCAATGPDGNRTIRFMNGSSHWVLSGMTINGGVVLSGANADATQNWQSKMISTKNWQARRAVPGSSTRAPAQLSQVTPYLSQVLHQSVSSADDIQLLDNTITGKGIFGRLTRFGVISGNTITNIACGTGPALWLSNFSSGWTIRNNDVSKVANSAASHYMHEGIRMGNQSDYNVVVGNTVHDMPGDSRAITTDQDGSWNTVTRNTVSSVAMAFNDQQAGWGNTWTYNLAQNIGQAAFSFRMQDIGFTAPSPNSSTYYAQVTCNRIASTPTKVRSFQAGAMKGGTISANVFPTPYVGKNLASYWVAQGNTWNGAKKLPSPSTSTAGC
ncbi:right-handed parallel beta-helix repeat-containing protein [Lapillicoccus jejuensis]|uniref:Chondroitinase B-like protein n=1 Tax=Lapillicoccus jejuensis TaxID=402171 RepID=A0A542E1I9_9MICO|nr:right-handed parallel beta-helix repeat-containing protein [Lapillicoccus jejuensis]TQJ09185.1 chondroitinase B-like protein [Lapillicoccus jejuensis]